MSSRDTKTAAAELGISNRELLALLRKMKWVQCAPRSKRHNLPYREYEINGLLAIEDRTYKRKPTDKLLRIYQVTLITQKGFEKLKEIIQGEEKPTPSPTTADDANTQAEHDKCIEQLREWGLAS